MKILLVFLLSLLCACSSVDIDDYKGGQPNFDLLTFFEGDVRAWGMVQDFSGKVTRRFNVKMSGQREGNQLTLDEDFLYDDGEVQHRQWVIKQVDSGLEGQAQDIFNMARGEQEGFAVRWRYEMDLKVDGEIYRVGFDDWMYRVDAHRAFNKARIKKFGITVAEVTLFFERTGTSASVD